MSPATIEPQAEPETGVKLLETQVMQDLETIEEYLSKYGPMLGQKAIDALDPLYVPGVTASMDMGMFGSHEGDEFKPRAPFPCQANVINAAALAWRRTKSLILCGEMGTGKTLLGAAAIHAAMIARGRSNYRVLIMAPNHLIDKWAREILKVVPHARTITFDRTDPNKMDDSYKGVLQYARSRKTDTDPKHTGRWNAPDCAEWVIVGRNQAKWDPDWKSIAETCERGNPGVLRTIVIGYDDKVDEDGRKVYDKRTFQPEKVPIKAEVVLCPACGQPARQANGLLISAEEMASMERTPVCKARYLEEVQGTDPNKKRPAEGYDKIVPAKDSKHWETAYKGDVDRRGRGRIVTIGERTYQVRECRTPLWQWVPAPRKWAPARIIQKKCHGLFDFFVLDEMHEEKGAESAQGLAAGKLISACKRAIGLTGTLIGGYADHLFAHLMRMAPGTLIGEGFRWKGELQFSRMYGRIDKTITRKFGEERATSSKRRGSKSMRKGDGTPTIREDVKPGVMPSFFGRHLMDKAIFIGLDEMYEDLPELQDDDRSLIAVDMDPELEASYSIAQRELVNANNELLMKGNLKLMSTLLHTLLAYPNKPFGWFPPPGCEKEKAVGWWNDAKDKRPKNYNGVTSPDNLPEDRTYPKEDALLNLIDEQAARGRQVWLYVEMTGAKRDIQSRLADLIRDRGYKVKILRSSTCTTREREEWIMKNAPGQDVIISNPDLVSTGLDFFDSDNFSYNFPTIVFYQPSYDVNAMRQAGRRHWRIGQTEPCETYYFYYRHTMEHRAVKHVGDKLAAAKSLEGKFSAEGLAALASGGLAMTEMARTLSQKIDDPRAAWSKLRGATKRKIARLTQDGTIATLAKVASAEPAHKVDAQRIAELLVFTPEDDDLLDDDTPIVIDDASLSRFQQAMADLGISLDDLDELDGE